MPATLFRIHTRTVLTRWASASIGSYSSNLVSMIFSTSPCVFVTRERKGSSIEQGEADWYGQDSSWLPVHCGYVQLQWLQQIQRWKDENAWERIDVWLQTNDSLVFAKHRRTIEVAKDSNIRISNVHVFLDAPLNSFHRKMEYREVPTGDDWLRTYLAEHGNVQSTRSWNQS